MTARSSRLSFDSAGIYSAQLSDGSQIPHHLEASRKLDVVRRGSGAHLLDVEAPKEWWEKGHESILDWRKHNLATLTVFTVTKGTILESSALWVEQLATCCIFLTVSSCIAFFPPPNYHVWIDSTQGNIRNFTTLLAGLAGFLLTFYLSLCIGRWWSLRIQGVGAMWNACSELTLFISRCVTQDKDVVHSIQRYVSASLLLIYLETQHTLDKLPRVLQSGLLKEDEVEALKTIHVSPAECIWAWVTEIVVMLNETGKIKSQPLYVFLLSKCNDGRDGVASITGYLNTPTPRIYVHLLSIMVKLHNFFLAMLMGMLAADALRERRIFVVLQISGRIFLMPLMYNAILLICEQLSNPFSGDLGGFPLDEYIRGMKHKSKSYLDAGRNLPPWLAQRRNVMPEDP